MFQRTQHNLRHFMENILSELRSRFAFVKESFSTYTAAPIPSENVTVFHEETKETNGANLFSNHSSPVSVSESSESTPNESPVSPKEMRMYASEMPSSSNKKAGSILSFQRWLSIELFLLLLAVGAFGAFFTIFGSTISRTKPFTFQGRLASSDYIPVADGSYSMKFQIFDAETNGSCKWATGGQEIAHPQTAEHRER